MDRVFLKEQLAQAREHVATSERNITRQRQMVAQLERDGHDTSATRQSLAQFEELLARTSPTATASKRSWARILPDVREYCLMSKADIANV
jgi:hypothetical protein